MTARPMTPRDDDGMVTAFVAVFVLALLALLGLVVDGGLTLAARVEAVDEAQAAARVGAQHLDLAAYRNTGDVVLDPAAAQQAARAYLQATGHRATVRVTGATVTVQVWVTRPMQILGVLGLHSLTVVETGRARATRGVTDPDS